MKNKYEKAEAAVIEFTENDDVIRCSNGYNNELPIRPFFDND